MQVKRQVITYLIQFVRSSGFCKQLLYKVIFSTGDSQLVLEFERLRNVSTSEIQCPSFLTN